ncbi:arf-GAP with GTPase, ANK repeat and PH domain-containing protein 1 [Oncorhynchus keta]|uniref:arf-GAP with GTPase, ANK repeat and PH domain-containing protein 1 n=1 Tax=Oncorhynchus keta TaxID=8018 RepID=UPI00227A64C7|nr:arf-GAP with GTPase, ANK repeat and PH domain-containing protein 1 [Oncorhynchus keta]
MNYQQHLANSAAIRSEIQRFESVHPNIYSIYELLERVEEPILQNQIREHVIAIEDSAYPDLCILLHLFLLNHIHPQTAVQHYITLLSPTF